MAFVGPRLVRRAASVCYSVPAGSAPRSIIADVLILRWHALCSRRVDDALLRPICPARCFASMIQAGDTDIEIPRSKLTLAFSRSSGAGGQNVNKVETKAEIRVHVPSADWMDGHTKGRLYELYSNAVTKDGDLIVTSQEHRTRERNIEAAIDKLRSMVMEAARIPAVREMRVDLTEHAKEARKQDKRIRSETKARRRSRGGDWED